MRAIYIIYSFGKQVLESNLALNDRKMFKTFAFSPRNVGEREREKRIKTKSTEFSVGNANSTIYRKALNMCLMHCNAFINS